MFFWEGLGFGFLIFIVGREFFFADEGSMAQKCGGAGLPFQISAIDDSIFMLGIKHNDRVRSAVLL